MEHRCGNRWPIEVPVRLETTQQTSTRAVLLVVSASGALIECAADIPIEARVVLSVRVQRQRLTLRAQIVRQWDRGYAIEWTEFSPEVVGALTSRRPHDSHSSLLPTQLR